MLGFIVKKVHGLQWSFRNRTSIVPHCNENFCIPKRGIARSQYQFQHSCLCERFTYIYSQDRSIDFPETPTVHTRKKFDLISLPIIGRLMLLRKWEKIKFWLFPSFNVEPLSNRIIIWHICWVKQIPFSSFPNPPLGSSTQVYVQYF